MVTILTVQAKFTIVDEFDDSGRGAGGFGHTYGALEMWQLLNPGIQKLNTKVTTGYWYNMLYLPGAMSLRYLRELMESRPFLDRIPDQALVTDPGSGREHVRATRASDGNYAFLYDSPDNDVLDADPESADSFRTQFAVIYSF